jgi:hypothetical protein
LIATRLPATFEKADALRKHLWQHRSYLKSSICIVKNLDLVDWTMQAARGLSPEHLTRSAPDSTRSLNKLLEVLQQVEPNANGTKFRIDSAPSIQLITESPTALRSSEIVAELEPNTVSNQANSTVPSTPANVWTEPPKSALLLAIVAPDIYAAPEDRDRAIVLRWALRDIKGERLKWSPVDQHDLQTLIDLGLVEIRDDRPVLTNAGISAII